MVSERAEILKSFDGNDIFFRCFTPKKREGHEYKIEGLVLAVHGFGEHSGRYADVAEAVCARNVAFACFDLRGHGKSGPRRGDAENLHAMILDVLFVVNHARGLLGIAHKPDIFYGIFGHSFGALLVTYAASILNVSCPPLFLSSPCYRLKQKVPNWKKMVAKSLPAFLPTLPVPLQILPENLSENPTNNGAYMADELNLFNITSRMGELFLNSLDMSLIKNAIPLIKAPLKIVCGARDKLVDTAAVKECLPLFSSGQASFQEIAEAGHEIFNERDTQRQEALSLLLSWIETKGAIR